MAASERSIRDELLAARDEIEKREETEVKEPEAPEVKVEEVKEPPVEAVRDDKGRFAPKETTPKETAPEAPTPEPKAALATEPAPVAPDPYAAAPASWTNAAKAKWPELPQELRAEIAKRETEVRRQASAMDEERSFGRELRKIIAPYEPIIRAEGGTPAAAVQDLLNTAYILRTGDPATKAQLFVQTAQRFGVDLSTLGQQQRDPQVANLQNEIAQLKANFARQQQTEAERAQQTALQTIEAFKSDPKHPHFDELQTHMAALISGGVAPDLEQAYEMALWARPDLRQQLLAQASLQKVEDKRHKVEKARTKGVSVRGGPGGVTPPAPNPNASVREDLMAALEETRGRL